MYKILLVSHGTIAKGFYDTLPMLVGTQEDAACVCLEENKSLEQFQTEMERRLVNEWGEEEVLILTDIANGTPARLAVQVSRQCVGERVILCNLNLSMLLEVYLKRSESVREVASLYTEENCIMMKEENDLMEGNE